MNSCFRRNESSFHDDIQDAIASLTASVNKLGQQLRKSGCASPTAGVVSGGAETVETKSSSFSSDPLQIRQLQFIGEWAQRNCTSSQAAPDTIVSVTSIQVPTEPEVCVSLTQHLTPSETIDTFFTGFQASVGKLGSQLLVEPRTLFQAPETQGIEAKGEKKEEIILSEQEDNLFLVLFSIG